MTSYSLWKNQMPPSALGRKLLAMCSPSGAPCHPMPSRSSAAASRGPGGFCAHLHTEQSSCSWSWLTRTIGPSWGPAPLGPEPVLTQGESDVAPTQGSTAACLLRKALPRAGPQGHAGTPVTKAGAAGPPQPQGGYARPCPSPRFPDHPHPQSNCE